MDMNITWRGEAAVWALMLPFFLVDDSMPRQVSGLSITIGTHELSIDSTHIVL